MRACSDNVTQNGAQEVRKRNTKRTPQICVNENTLTLPEERAP